jgi:hypothetical protein
MVRAKVIYPAVELLFQGLAERNRVYGLSANSAPHKFHGCHFFPLPFQQVLKFYGALRTNPPAISASGTFGHIVQDDSPVAVILALKGTRRAILNARETAGAPAVYLKKRHVLFSVAAISSIGLRAAHPTLVRSQGRYMLPPKTM